MKKRINMSKLKEHLWNSVVVGRWNPAILTPKGIADLIFRKADDVPVEVLIPLDAANEPARVKFEGLIVQANFERLAIDCEKPNWESLEKARKHCCVAIDALPVTPFSAAGFNLRYHLLDPEDDFITSLSLPIDARIADNGLEITGRALNRYLAWGKEKSICIS